MEIEHVVLLVFTAVVALLLLWAALLLSKAVSQKTTATSPDLLAEYGRMWCVQQAVPFVDKLLGVAGAMDNRMLVPWQNGPADWMIRFPLIILCAIWPSPSLLLVGHLANIASWATWMPAVWDHMCWAALLELTFVLAALGGGGAAAIANRFLPAASAQLIVLYFSAAFWKLTTSWYDTYSSCAPVLLSELLSGLAPPSVLPAGSPVANFLLQISPVFVAALEFAVPTAMLVKPVAGVLLALVFHQTINLMPMTYAGGFSLAMCSRFTIIAPGSISTALQPRGNFIVPSAIVAAITAVMVAVHGRLDSAGSAFLLLTFFYLRGMRHAPTGGKTSSTSAARFLRVTVVTFGFIYGFLTPIAGLQAMASSTMYGNVKQFGGTNHLVVPTGLLQEHFAASTTGSWAADAFGGGLVRVDFTNSSVLQELTPADATGQLPKHARALLAGLGTSGAYFELYAARNYFGRRGDLNASALHNRGSEGPRLDDPPYAQPAYEFRRVLALARVRGERFKVVYTHLPWHGSPGQYRDYRGPQVVLEEDAASGIRHCTSDGSPCKSDEIALLPAPPAWLRWLLHPYPMPLLTGDTTEVHCST